MAGLPDSFTSIGDEMAPLIIQITLAKHLYQYQRAKNLMIVPTYQHIKQLIFYIKPAICLLGIYS